jgi:hypothetical protein
MPPECVQEAYESILFQAVFSLDRIRLHEHPLSSVQLV